MDCDDASNAIAGSTMRVESTVSRTLLSNASTDMERSSLDAALEPEDTSYYYFVLNKEANEHVFARTYAEHQRNLQK